MTETARLYGGSLFQLAAEEGQDTQILAELDTVAALFKGSPEYLRLLSTPSLPKKERTGLLDEALRGQVHPYLLNFFKLLCDEGLLPQVEDSRILHQVQGSDHCPVELLLKEGMSL